MRSLINSALQPHASIHLDQSSIIEGERDVNPLTAAGSQQNINLQMAGVLAPDGIYTIVSMRRVGDTRALDWYDDLTTIAVSGGSTTQAQKDAGLSLGPS